MTTTKTDFTSHGPSADFEPLSTQDRLFLLSETESTHMHVGVALLIDAGPLAKRNAGVAFDRIKRHIASRLSQVPRYRQRISFAPLHSLPHWVDDERFDIDHHVRHVRLPQPGNEAQLKQLCGQFFSQRLDHERPLWEVLVVEGLGQDQFALVAKTHHCLVDGIGGVNLLAALLDPHAEVAHPRPDRWAPKPPPTAAEVFRLEIAHQIEQSRHLGNQLRDWMQTPRATVGKLGEQVLGMSQFLSNGLWPAPDCVLNQPIGAQRRFEWLTFSLDDVKAVKQALGGTINDVVLATVAGALRGFLRQHRRTSCPAELRALVPVNMRQPNEAEALGNHISALLVGLPVSICDPQRRYLAVVDRMQQAKASKQAVGGQALAGASAPLLATLMRFADRLKTFNVVVTNVPGPPIPLYLAGARVSTVFPQVPLFVNQGLGIALFSYAGNLHWGLIADRHVVPDIVALKTAVVRSFDELREAAGRKPTMMKTNVLTWAPRAASGL